MTPFTISRCPLNPVGEIALSRMPGAITSIEDDVAEIVALDCACVLTLAPEQELAQHGAAQLPAILKRVGLPWHHFPIEDYGTPAASQMENWRDLSQRLHQYLDDDRKILIHCYAGIGRSGTIALRLMVERGADPIEALAQIRHIRPGAVERPAQYEWAIAGINQNK
jgi:protein-tyrosine phosphatase